MKQFDSIKHNFIQQWGTLGSNWGMNKTFAQVHGLLMVSDQPLSTDDVMNELHISRGNAHANLKELLKWGLAKLEYIQGERKDYYVGIKDPWRMFYQITKERQRREIDPMLDILEDCISQSKTIKTSEAKEFSKQLSEVNDFIRMGSSAIDKLLGTQKSNMFQWLLKRLN